MEPFKALTVVIAAIMIIANNSVMSQTVFEKETDTIKIYEYSYKIVYQDDYVMDIELDSAFVMDEISGKLSPIFQIFIDDKIIIVRGNLISYSGVPKDCNFFYPLDENNNVILFKNILHIGKVPSSIKCCD